MFGDQLWPILFGISLIGNALLLLKLLRRNDAVSEDNIMAMVEEGEEAGSIQSNEKELIDVYNSVDLFVTPSLEENLPNTIMEAMACGIPCVGFQVGGIPEMIDHLHNGYVAEYKSVEDFANGIHWILNEGEYKTLSEEACRKVSSSYSESAIAKRYIEVYNKVTGSNE